MFIKFLFAITALFLLELYLLIELGNYAGAFNIIMFIIFTAIGGFFLTKLNGKIIIKNLLQCIKTNNVPTFQVLEGIILLIGGFLLILPGILSDLIGLLFVISYTRKIFINHFGQKIQKSNFFNQLNIKLKEELIKKGHLK